MKKKLSLLVLLFLLLLPFTAKTAYADYDEILAYDIEVVPEPQDGSLGITMRFDWKALETLPHGTELKIGIPNGSIRDLQRLTDNIESIDYDNSYMYVYMDREYKGGESFTFAFSWVQEYMYTLANDGSVSFDYTPGWFDEARIDRMSVRWASPAGTDSTFSWSADEKSKWSLNGDTLSAVGLGHGSRLSLRVDYADWPTDLSWDGSSENLPGGEWQEWVDPAPYDDDDGTAALIFFVIFIIIVVFIIIVAAGADDGYRGGFGTVHHTYIYTGGLWYPAGPDHKPIPGSIGLVKKPSPPKSSGSHKGGGGFGGGGFGGGSRGGGFGGGGFGGGSRCACASSCACACACACAGGGRAGCSAKNLYGAVKLDREVSRAIGADGHEEL